MKSGTAWITVAIQKLKHATKPLCSFQCFNNIRRESLGTACPPTVYSYRRKSLEIKYVKTK